MREIFFNSFKEKILNGEVGSVINASGIPMNEDFLDTYDTDDISIEQYRNLDDFDRFSKGNNTTSFNDTKFKYDMYGVDYQNYYEDDISEKPIFVNSDNSGKFLKVYGEELCYNSNSYVKEKIDRYLDSNDVNINSGFYYVTKKAHLNWLAKRVNDEYNFNNRLVIVLGDDIGTANEASGTAYESVIGANPNKPFQGTFDLNGHAVHNLNLQCKSNSNGIIGYLGTDGVVKDGLVISPKFTGLNKISLKKIESDCSDVVCGTLVGTNYGTVENIITSGDMEILEGFCPEVYVAGNKSEYQEGMNTYEANNYTNAFFPSKFCINSIYNVIPYVGYFCEGADSYFNDIGLPSLSRGSITDRNEYWRCMTSACVNVQIGMDYKNDTWTINGLPLKEFNLDHYMEGKLSNNTHCDLREVELTRVVPDALYPTSGHGYSWDINRKSGGLSGSPDVIWYGGEKKRSAGNTYLADIYRAAERKPNDKTASYLRPLITMSNDQVIPDRLMKNTVKSVKTFVDFQGNEIYDGLDKDLSYMYEYSDYAASIAHQIRDQIMLFYSDTNRTHRTTHQKMNPYSRIAYYLSPIVGNNFGTIRNIDCRHTIVESRNTFVGFIGNICGKENCGDISDCRVDLDIMTDTVSASTSAAESDLAVRQYKDTNEYLPDYASMNSAYNNMLNFFGYNYDYYQTSAGLSESEIRDIYPNVSGDCVKVSRRFYEYHDLCYSGVQEGSEANAFIYNKDSLQATYTDKDKRLWSNFRIYDDTKPEEIGRAIVESGIKNAKMRFTLVGDDLGQVPTGYEILAVYDVNPVEGATYEASFKIYNPYHRDRPDNYHFGLTVAQVRELMSQTYEYVSHMDLNYLGDAAKCVNGTDTWTQSPGTFHKADGSEYTPTVSEVLTFGTSFNGTLGNTLQNAQCFCRNMMDSKVAIGYDMLGNQDFNVDYRYPDYKYPFSNNKGFFGSTLFEKKAVIPSGQGPNDSSEDWVLSDNMTDIEYFMGPAPSKYGDNGPESFNTGVKPNNNKSVNVNADNPGGFCSVHPYGLWDLYGDPDNSDAKFFDEIRNASRPSIMRTMLTVELRNGDAIASKAIKYLLNSGAAWLTSLIQSNPTSDKNIDNYKYKLNKVFVPMANRTQHNAYQSNRFEGTDCSGIYLRDVEQIPVAKPDYSDTASEYSDDIRMIGNLDHMYLDCSVSVPVGTYSSDTEDQEGVNATRQRYETYPIIFQIPIKELFIPISAIKEDTAVHDVTTRVVNDILTEELEAKTVKQREFHVYHLTPAYDLTESRSSQIQYKLKSIYNIGGIAGMINHSERFIEHGNNAAGLGQNLAECGSIRNCRVNITQRTNQFIDDLQGSKEIDQNRYGDTDPRTIGITNKIAGVAPIYEYRQNDMGTSPYTRSIKSSTDGLMRFGFQTFVIENLNVGGEENKFSRTPSSDQVNELRRRINRKIFSPFIEWANISNMLDTTNVFGYKESYTRDERYLAHHSSNFPIDGNPQLYTSWMQLRDDDIYDRAPKPLVSQIDSPMAASCYPIPSTNADYNTDWQNQDRGNFAYLESMSRYGSTSADQDYDPNGTYSDPWGWANYPRIGFYKRYDYMPGFLISCRDVFLYNGNGNFNSPMHISMSPMANSPCSDYNDVYLQMFSGNPNFVNRKLSKPSITASISVGFTTTGDSYEALVARDIATDVEKLYNQRGSQKYRDKYFTWDYETSARKSVDPLRFTIRYKKPKGHSRGLWIHQEGEGTYDDYEVLRYAMKGGDRGINDGACLHLGYLPSDWAVVQILNADEFGTSALPGDTEDEKRFNEGHAVSGYGFNGMLLFDQDTKDLICYFDTEDARDFDIGCWVAPLSEKVEIEDRKYGLLTEIVAENSPKVEQDPNDDTEVTIEENVVYNDNRPENLSAPVIQENVVYVDNRPESI